MKLILAILIFISTATLMVYTNLNLDPENLWLPESLGLDSLSWSAGAVAMAIMSTAAFLLYWLTEKRKIAEQELYICVLKERILQLKERNAHARMRIEQLQIAEQAPQVHDLRHIMKHLN